METARILLLRLSMILESIRLLEAEATLVEEMEGLGSVLIVLLSMRVVGRIVISVDYRLVAKGREMNRSEVLGMKDI